MRALLEQTVAPRPCRPTQVASEIANAPSGHHSGILPEYFPGSRDACCRPIVFRSLLQAGLLRSSMCRPRGFRENLLSTHRSAAQGRSVMPQWHGFACDASFMAGLACGGRGGLPSQACPSSEMSNEIAMHIALFTILVQYMLVKHIDFAQQFSESLVIAVVFLRKQ